MAVIHRLGEGTPDSCSGPDQRNLLLDDVEDFRTECRDQPAGEAGPDPFDETGSEEPLHPLGSGGRSRLEVRSLELESMGAVVHPAAGSLDRFTRRYARRLADDSHKVPSPPHGHAQDGEAALFAVECHSFDRPGEEFPWPGVQEASAGEYESEILSRAPGHRGPARRRVRRKESAPGLGREEHRGS